MKFGVIVSDPPWSFSDKLAMSDVKRSAEANYGVMSAEDIVGMDVASVAADDAVLLLWCPASLLRVGMTAMRSYGFDLKQQWVWVKTASREDRLDSDNVPGDLGMAFGMGRLARGACEFALVGTRGKVYRHLKNRSQRNVFLAPNLKHSAKPECVQDALDTMFPDLDKLEIFARRQRFGWVCVGNECPNTADEDVRYSIAQLAGVAVAA